MPRHIVQTISGSSSLRNEEKQSVLILPHCHQQASFKRLVEENQNGTHHKHNHEKHERELAAEGSVTREEFDQPWYHKNDEMTCFEMIYITVAQKFEIRCK